MELITEEQILIEKTVKDLERQQKMFDELQKINKNIGAPQFEPDIKNRRKLLITIISTVLGTGLTAVNTKIIKDKTTQLNVNTMNPKEILSNKLAATATIMTFNALISAAMYTGKGIAKRTTLSGQSRDDAMQNLNNIIEMAEKSIETVKMRESLGNKEKEQAITKLKYLIRMAKKQRSRLEDKKDW